MGYYATGGGTLKITSPPLPEEIMEETRNIFHIFSRKVDTDLDIEFDEKYYESEMETWASDIAPYVSDGVLYFCGEDDCHWRFVFEDKTWRLDYGHIVYDTDPALELSETKKEELLNDIVKTILLSTDGKPSVNQPAPTDEQKRRLSDVLRNWHIL